MRREAKDGHLGGCADSRFAEKGPRCCHSHPAAEVTVGKVVAKAHKAREQKRERERERARERESERRARARVPRDNLAI